MEVCIHTTNKRSTDDKSIGGFCWSTYGNILVIPLLLCKMLWFVVAMVTGISTFIAGVTKAIMIFVDSHLYEETHLFLKEAIDGSCLTLRGRGFQSVGLLWFAFQAHPATILMNGGDRYTPDHGGTYCGISATRYCGAWPFRALKVRSRIM